MQVISNFSLKKFGKTQKTGVSYSVLLLIDSYLGFSVTNIFYLIFISINSKIAKKKKKTYFESNMQKNCTNRKKQQLYGVSSKIILHLIECVCLPF